MKAPGAERGGSGDGPGTADTFPTAYEHKGQGQLTELLTHSEHRTPTRLSVRSERGRAGRPGRAEGSSAPVSPVSATAGEKWRPEVKRGGVRAGKPQQARALDTTMNYNSSTHAVHLRVTHTRL